MKKFALWSVLALGFGFGFTACDDYEEPNPPAQYNPQESILKTDEVVVVSLLDDANTYDLQDLNNQDKDIEVASITCATLPATYEFGSVVTISNNDFATSTPVNATVTPGENEGEYVVLVAPDDLQTAFYNGISKGPSAKNIQIRMQVTTISGSQVAYVGGAKYYYGPWNMNVLPFPSELVIEDGYYLIGTADDWSVANSGAFKFSHSDQSPYDDPVFSLVIDITQEQAEAGWWWKIIPQSTYDNGDWMDADYSQFGVEENGADALTGMLVPKLNGVDPGAGQFNHAGRWMLTINMEDMTFEFTNAVEFLYTPGDANGWNQLASQLLSTTDFMNYSGYAVLSPGGFKFSTQPNWDGVNYGDGGAEGVLSTDGGAGNLTVPGLGLYWCNVNISALTYSTTMIETIGLIGSAVETGWDASMPMTPSADYLTWTGEFKLTGGQEFKFRANNGWDINLGGQYGDLVQGGDNLPVAEDGTYTVTLNLGQLPYSCTLVKK